MAMVLVVMLHLFVVADEFDFVDVEGDRGQIEVDGVVGVAAKDAPAGGYLQPAKVLVAAGVVADQGAAVDLDDVVHAPLQALGIEVEHLIRVVGGD